MHSYSRTRDHFCLLFVSTVRVYAFAFFYTCLGFFALPPFPYTLYGISSETKENPLPESVESAARYRRKATRLPLRRAREGEETRKTCAEPPPFFLFTALALCHDKKFFWCVLLMMNISSQRPPQFSLTAFSRLQTPKAHAKESEVCEKDTRVGICGGGEEEEGESQREKQKGETRK